MQPNDLLNKNANGSYIIVYFINVGYYINARFIFFFAMLYITDNPLRNDQLLPICVSWVWQPIAQYLSRPQISNWSKRHISTTINSTMSVQIYLYRTPGKKICMIKATPLHVFIVQKQRLWNLSICKPYNVGDEDGDKRSFAWKRRANEAKKIVDPFILFYFIFWEKSRRWHVAHVL